MSDKKKLINWDRLPQKRVNAAFWLCFVIGYSADDAYNISGNLEKWQMDELAQNGLKAWRFLEGEILNAIPPDDPDSQLMLPAPGQV